MHNIIKLSLILIFQEFYFNSVTAEYLNSCQINIDYGLMSSKTGYELVANKTSFSAYKINSKLESELFELTFYSNN